MSRKEKLIARLLTYPKDFTWDELLVLLSFLGFEEKKKGKTGGSRRKFIHKASLSMINLHEPHPRKILKSYAIEQIINKLNEDKLL